MTEVLKELNINFEGKTESLSLARRLRDDGFVDYRELSMGRCQIAINTYGVDYCEQSSYTFTNNSLITNNFLNISNSPNANIISQSSYVSIENQKLVQTKIEKFKDALNKSSEISNEKRTEILECLKEIQNCLSKDIKPKYSIKAFIEQTANIAGISSLGIEIAKLVLG